MADANIILMYYQYRVFAYQTWQTPSLSLNSVSSLVFIILEVGVLRQG